MNEIQELRLGNPYLQIAFHRDWLNRIKQSVEGISYISHVKYPSRNHFAVKVIMNGTNLEFPLEGDPKFMLDENYQDFMAELKTYEQST